LTTVEREYCSLKALPYYNLQAQVTSGTSGGPAQELRPEMIQSAMQIYQVNDSQAKAILRSIDGSGFSLIQG
jgi:senataxin